MFRLSADLRAQATTRALVHFASALRTLEFGACLVAASELGEKIARTLGEVIALSEGSASSESTIASPASDRAPFRPRRAIQLDDRRRRNRATQHRARDARPIGCPGARALARDTRDRCLHARTARGAASASARSRAARPRESQLFQRERSDPATAPLARFPDRAADRDAWISISATRPALRFLLCELASTRPSRSASR